MNTKIVFEILPTKSNPRNSEGAFIKLKDGSLLFAYSRFHDDASDDGHAVIGSCVSQDDGQTWEIVENPIVESDNCVNVMSVSLLRSKSDELLLLYLVKDSHVHYHHELRRSSDEGASWSSPIISSTEPGAVGKCNDRVIRLSTGRIVAPRNQHLPTENRNESLTPHDAGFWKPGNGLTFFSDDDGWTWKVSKPIIASTGLCEPSVVELKDGRLWQLFRTNTGRQWQTFSEDGGESWSPVEPSVFQSPPSPLGMKRIPQTGHLLAVWNDSSGRFPLPDKADLQVHWMRTTLVAAISEDEGETWKHHRAIEHDFKHGYCYPNFYFGDDHLLLGYCAGGPEFGPVQCVLCRLRMRRISLDWLYDKNG